MVGDMATNNKKQILNEDVVIRNILDRIRGAKLNESYESSDNSTKDAIAITNDPKFGQEVLKNQIEEFKSAVDSGAKFASENSENPSSSPLVYMPKDGNLVFSGTIPSMNNLKWQFSLNDENGTGLFIWADGLRLTKDNIKKLNSLNGHYENWKKQWEQSSSMLENLGNKNE